MSERYERAPHPRMSVVTGPRRKHNDYQPVTVRGDDEELKRLREDKMRTAITLKFQQRRLAGEIHW